MTNRTPHQPPPPPHTGRRARIAPWLARLRDRLDAIDAAAVRWMSRTGHSLHRITLGLVFVWFGALKLAGYPTATTILAHTVFLGPPDVTVRILGGWEVLIGLCLIARPLIRIAIPLLLVRLVGTAMALALKPDVCFAGVPWVPTPEGQYLVKDLMLFAAAVVIGGSARTPRQHSPLSPLPQALT